MDEIAAITVVSVVLVLGLMGLGWAYGDFERPTDRSQTKDER